MVFWCLKLKHIFLETVKLCLCKPFIYSSLERFLEKNPPPGHCAIKTSKAVRPGNNGVESGHLKKVRGVEDLTYLDWHTRPKGIQCSSTVAKDTGITRLTTDPGHNYTLLPQTRNCHTDQLVRDKGQPLFGNAVIAAV